MAEPLGVVASAIAVIQISKEVISTCKFYIEALRSDAPTSLRTLLIEISTLKSVLENLEFISKCETFTPAVQNRLTASDGPIEGCRAAMTALERLFPKQSLRNGQNISKRQKVQATFATLAWPLKQGQVQDLLQQISRHREGIQLALTTEVTKDIKDIKAASEEIHSILTEEQRHRVYNWLTTTDPSPIHNRSRKLYEDGTGSWMLRSQHWNDWLASSIRCLWVHGIPGSGKTVLASWLIANVQAHCKTISTGNSPCVCAYYYCYFGHHQDEAAPFLRWVITQISRERGVVSTLVHDLFKSGAEPSISELLGALEQILDAFRCVYIVIDAVDESDPRYELLEVIGILVTSRRFTNLQILVTSREYIEIERVLVSVSVSVPMSNELVEQDIRILVRSNLRSNAKFRCWPKDLLIEVEDAVSTKAKGMFRWAICQLHELQRLKGDRDVVGKALERLPKDLDETYDRIFLRIPREDWEFVSHTFQWLCFYGELDHPEVGIPSVLLVDAVESSTSRTDDHNSHVLYNSERLRELCGCLVSSLYDSISFAHYTVKEYLASTRIRQGPLFIFSTERNKVLSTCLDGLLLEARNFALQKLKHLGANDSLLFHSQDLWTNLGFHSFLFAKASLKRWEKEISESNNIYIQAKRLLCPSMQYFRCLGKLGFKDEQQKWSRQLLSMGFVLPQCLWTIDWNEYLTDNEASLFLTLFLFSDHADSPLISRLIREANLKTLFNSKIVLKKEGCIYTSERNQGWNSICRTYEFDGPLLEVLPQLVDPETRNFRGLLVNHTGLYNPSTALIYFMGNHPSYPDNKPLDDCSFFCPLRHLLKAGAQPNLAGYPLTPLQIAVAARNLEGVRLLLYFSADPNHVGDPHGSAWSENSMLAGFRRFYGLSPLRICRSGYGVSLAESFTEDGDESALETIQQLLLARGAKDFQLESSEPLTA